MSVVVSLLIWVLTVSISSVGTGYKLYFGQESAPLLYAKKELCNNNQSEIKLLKQSYETLNKNIDKLGERIQEREKKVDEQFRDQNQKMEKSFDEIKSFMKTILRHTNSDRNNQ